MYTVHESMESLLFMRRRRRNEAWRWMLPSRRQLIRHYYNFPHFLCPKNIQHRGIRISPYLCNATGWFDDGRLTDGRIAYMYVSAVNSVEPLSGRSGDQWQFMISSHYLVQWWWMARPLAFTRTADELQLQKTRFAGGNSSHFLGSVDIKYFSSTAEFYHDFSSTVLAQFLWNIMIDSPLEWNQFCTW